MKVKFTHNKKTEEVNITQEEVQLLFNSILLYKGMYDALDAYDSIMKRFKIQKDLLKEQIYE